MADNETRLSGDKSESATETRPASSATSFAGGTASVFTGGATAPAAAPEAAQGSAPRLGEDWRIGDVVSDLYEVTAHLGEGGMGKVFKVRHRGWQIDLAVKCPKREVFANSGGRESFIREAETWVDLGIHPHIVSCYYVRTIDDVPRVFAEYVDGGSLSDAIRKRTLYAGDGPALVGRILDVAIQFAWGLAYAHTRHLVHQDVKPANVMIASDGTVKVTDFGLAKARHVAEFGNAEAAGVLVTFAGMTPAYCSPEQAGRKTLSLKTDIWSWAVSVLEMFNGEITWLAGQAADEALEGYLEDGPADESLPPMPDEVGSLLRQCLSLETEARPADLLEVASRLKKIYAVVTGHAYERKIPKPAEWTADGLNNRALSFLDLDKRDAALSSWKEALTADPLHPETIFNSGIDGWRRAQCSDRDVLDRLEALRDVEQVKSRVPYLLGLTHLERGDLESARTFFKQSGQGFHAEVMLANELLDASNVASIRVAAADKVHGGAVSSLAVTPDSLSAIGSATGALRVYDLRQKRTHKLAGHNSSVTAVCFTPDRQFVVSAGLECSIRMWSLQTNECAQTYGIVAQPPTSLAVSHDGRYLVAGFAMQGALDLDAALKLWDLGTRRLLRSVRKAFKCAHHLSLLPPFRAVSISEKSVGNIDFWDLQSGSHELECAARAHALCVMPDKAHILTGETGDQPLIRDASSGYSVSSETSLLVLRDARDGRKLRAIPSPVSSTIQVTPDSRFVLAGGGRTVCWIDLQSGRCLRTFELEHAVTQVAFGFGKWGFAGDASGRFLTFELSTRPLFAVPLRLSTLHSHSELVQAESHVNDLVNRADSELREGNVSAALAKLREARKQPGFERAPRLAEYWAKAALRSRRVGLRGSWKVAELAFQEPPSAFSDLAGQLWKSGDPPAALVAHDLSSAAADRESDRCLTFADQGLAVEIDFSRMKVFSLPGRREVCRMEGHKGKIEAVASSQDGRLLFSGGRDKQFRVWSAQDGRCLLTLLGSEEGITSVHLTHDGRFAVTGCGGTQTTDTSLRLWDLAAGKCVHCFGDIWDPISSIAVSADDQYLVAIVAKSFSSGSLRVWRLQTGELIGTSDAPLPGIARLHVLPDRKWAFVDNKLFSIPECAPAGELPLKDGRIEFSPDERWVLYCAQSQLQLWEIDWELQAADAAWDDAVDPFLRVFLTQHTPTSGLRPSKGLSGQAELAALLTPCGNPSWADSDLAALLQVLGRAGLGWISADAVRQRLTELAGCSVS